ncbi:MAG: hypothetical protein ACOYJA_03615 [Christensenellales bacterium]|jgi:drug/metabolite transporter (DMT)-like permease
MEILSIAAAVGLFALQSAALRKVSAPTLRDNLLATGASAGMIALAFGVIWLCQGGPLAPVTAALGAAVGVDFLATLMAYHLAMRAGPLSYTGFFFSASMVIPAAVGVALWGEPLTLPVGVGMALMLAAFFCISALSGPGGGRVNKRWLGLCALTFLLNGSLSVLITAHQRALGGGSLASSARLLCVAFLTAFVIAGAVFLLGGGAARRREDLGRVRRGLLPLALVALGTGGGNLLVSYLSGRVPSSYLFPIVQGGTLLAITLYARLALGEKLSAAGRAGIVLGVAAIVALSL